jgi:hypothetical protein
MSTPPLLRQLLDDAAVFPPGSASLPEAVESHREYRSTWYSDLVGPLLVPASQIKTLSGLLKPDETMAVGVIADGIALGDLFRPLTPRGIAVRQVEAPVARRGEDPQPTLRRLIELLQRYALAGFAEVPLAWGLLAALDTIASARESGVEIAAKFRTGGLAAELFPTPVELRMRRAAPAVQADGGAAPRHSPYRCGDRLYPPRVSQRPCGQQPCGARRRGRRRLRDARHHPAPDPDRDGPAVPVRAARTVAWLWHLQHRRTRRGHATPWIGGTIMSGGLPELIMGLGFAHAYPVGDGRRQESMGRLQEGMA